MKEQIEDVMWTSEGFHISTWDEYATYHHNQMLEIVDSISTQFEQCISRLVTPQYAAGYREALEHVKAKIIK